ncbi:MAG: Gfo/Idh/MocA family oxidoreductase [Hyphomicrobiales bacterium]|nr:Gfo/Idh/MocA family oxidoreductase [Hyphomicrobiales bacterium]
MKIALFGAGVMGRIHARNINRSAGCSLAYVVDQDGDRAKELTASFGGHADTTIDRALADDTLEGVIVASSTDAHKVHVMAAARAGKALLCEKPVADSLDDARACHEAVALAGVVAVMGFNRRLDTVHQDLYRGIAAGEVGTVEMLRLVSRSASPPDPRSAAHSGGMIREKGAHFFDLACWLAGADPVEVSAMGGCLVDQRFADYGDVDTAILTLRLEGGVMVGFDFGRRTAYGVDELIEVFGSDGLLLADRQAVPRAIRRSGRDLIQPGLNQDWHERFAPTYVDELDSFVRAIRGDQTSLALMADGLRAQAISEAAIKALTERRTITVQSVWVA